MLENLILTALSVEIRDVYKVCVESEICYFHWCAPIKFIFQSANWISMILDRTKCYTWFCWYFTWHSLFCAWYLLTAINFVNANFWVIFVRQQFNSLYFESHNVLIYGKWIIIKFWKDDCNYQCVSIFLKTFKAKLWFVIQDRIGSPCRMLKDIGNWPHAYEWIFAFYCRSEFSCIFKLNFRFWLPYTNQNKKIKCEMFSEFTLQCTAQVTKAMPDTICSNREIVKLSWR